MKIANKVEIKLENYEKCCALADVDCSLGQIYDFACALKGYINQRIQEEEQSKEKQETKE